MKVAGRLHVEIYRTHPKHAIGEEFEENNNNSSLYGQQITCRVKIRKAANLPPTLANFVFCQYRFWGQPDPVVVAPAYDSVENPPMGRKETEQGVTFVFDHEQVFKLTLLLYHIVFVSLFHNFSPRISFELILTSLITIRFIEGLCG